MNSQGIPSIAVDFVLFEASTVNTIQQQYVRFTSAFNTHSESFSFSNSHDNSTVSQKVTKNAVNMKYPQNAGNLLLPL
jgi:hypothetical protein